MIISVVIPFMPLDESAKEMTAQCVYSLLSDDVEIIALSGEEGFSKTVNRGFKKAKGEWLFCVNNDTFAPPEWKKLTENYGIVCPRESKMPSFDPRAPLLKSPKGFFGGFWGYPRKVYEEVGGFDERFSPMFCEDTDLLYRCQLARVPIIQDNRILVAHGQSVTNKKLWTEEEYQKIFNTSVEKFKEKWGIDPISYQH